MQIFYLFLKELDTRHHNIKKATYVQDVAFFVGTSSIRIVHILSSIEYK